MIIKEGLKEEKKTEVEQYILNWIVTDNFGLHTANRKPIPVRIGDLLNPPNTLETPDGQLSIPKWTWADILKFYPQDIAELLANLLDDIKMGVVK